MIIVLTLITFLRIASAYYITINPFAGLIVYWMLDYLDAWPLQQGLKMSWKSYQKWDKITDIAGYAAMFYLGAVGGYGLIFLLLVIYRLIGSVFFLVWNKQSVLLFFPNLIEVFFIWAILLKGIYPVVILPILFILKEMQEYFLHIYWPKYLKVKGFPKIFAIFGAKGKVNL